MRTILMATGEIALPTLRRLVSGMSGLDLITVVTGEDQPFGRKLEMRAPAVKTIALEAGLSVLQPRRLRDIHAELTGLAPDLIVVMAYGQILRKAVLELPKVACLNLHASILPRHRGASPIQAALLAGDERSGVTVMHMARGLDTGDMVYCEEIPLGPEITGGELHDALGDLAPAALEKALALMADGVLPRTPQDESIATHCGKLSRADGEIDWTLDPVVLKRRIRAFSPWPASSTTLHVEGRKPRRIKILPQVQAVSENVGCAQAGTVLSVENGALLIAAGEGALRVREVQAEGGRAMAISEFLNGTPIEPGDRLGS